MAARTVMQSNLTDNVGGGTRLELNRARLNWAGQEAFNRAVERANSFTSKPNSDELLKLYGLYKQGTTRDVNTGKADNAPPPGR